MDDVIEFVRRFIDAEYRALRASYVEPDEARYREVAREAEGMLDSRPGWPMSLGFGRPPNPDAARLASMRSAAEQFTPRTLFAVRRIEHPKLGPLFVAVVSSFDKDGGGEYDERWVVRRSEGGPRIIARQTLDFAERSRLVWEDGSGEPIDIESPVLEERRLAEPEVALHRADWSAER